MFWYVVDKVLLDRIYKIKQDLHVNPGKSVFTCESCKNVVTCESCKNLVNLVHYGTPNQLL